MHSTDFGKDAWVAMYRELGLDEAQMHRWHVIFEQRWPEDHDRFLRWLGIAEAEVQRIREAARA